MTEDFNNTSIDPYHSIRFVADQARENLAANRKLLKGAHALTRKDYPATKEDSGFSMGKANRLANFFRNMNIERRKEDERDQKDQDIGFGIVALSADPDDHDILYGLDPTHNFSYN